MSEAQTEKTVLRLLDPEATQRLGGALARALRGQLAGASRGILCVYLIGPLGAGKTTLVRGLMRELGYDGPVKSPTYTLIEPYEIASVDKPLRVFHLDLYRLREPEELEMLGYRDLLAEHDALCLVEWPEMGEGFLAGPDLTITLDHCEAGRIGRLGAQSEFGKAVLANIFSDESIEKTDSY